ncbi:MAG TPA: hypothetical protein DIT61_18360 [Pseudomonas sp.]|jgi:hypothetical protein|nr:hypothetical protein [Pseudomonas sp.]|tara:strand:- start:2277 stop:2732 length:456 start_codon:yes stop_codon:yes gene_type:complete
MNILTLARESLIARLSEVTQDNGFLTNAGLAVRSGWFNEIIKSDDVSFPLIVVQKGRDAAPEPGPCALKLQRAFYVFGAVEADMDDYDEALENVELDILRALIPFGGQHLPWAPQGVSKIEFGTPEHVPPGSGESAACVLIPIQLSVVIRE